MRVQCAGAFCEGDALGSHMFSGIYPQIGSLHAGSAVQGAIAGEAGAKYAKAIVLPVVSIEALANFEDDILAPLKWEAGYGPAWVSALRQRKQGIP